jgi:membrane protease YdiL (CAAX protease family)
MLLFFGLLHVGLGWTGMLVATTTGLTLTLLFVWRRSLVSVVIAHALINALVLML